MQTSPHARKQLLGRRAVPGQLLRMENTKKTRRPGDLFLDRYMPNATEGERELAYENLRGLISILVKIDQRIARGKSECPDSHD